MSSQRCMECTHVRADCTCHVFASADRRPIVIVESPFAGDTKRNLAYLLRAFEWCFNSGYLPIASHAMFTQVLDDKLPDQRKRGIEWGYEYWDCADRLFFFIDYGMSPGMTAAHAEAILQGRRVEEISIGKNP